MNDIRLQSLSLSKNNLSALQKLLETMSTMEKDKELMSILMVTFKPKEEGGVFNVESVSNDLIPTEISDAMCSSILITLKHFNFGEGEIVADGP